MILESQFFFQSMKAEYREEDKQYWTIFCNNYTCVTNEENQLTNQFWKKDCHSTTEAIKSTTHASHFSKKWQDRKDENRKCFVTTKLTLKTNRILQLPSVVCCSCGLTIRKKDQFWVYLLFWIVWIFYIVCERHYINYH